MGNKNLNTVNSRYCGHSRDRDLVSVLARVRTERGAKKKILESEFTGRVLLKFAFILTAIHLTRTVFARTKSIVIKKLT